MNTMRQTWKQLLAAFALVTTLGTENTLTPATIAEEASSGGKAEPAGSRVKPSSAKPSAASSGSEPSPAEPLMTKVFRLNHSDPTDMATALKPALSDQSRIVPDARARQLVVLGTEKELQDVGSLIEKLDQAPAGKAPDGSAAHEEILRHHNYNRLMLERYGLIPKGSTLAANAPSASPDELMRQRYALPAAKKDKGRVESKLEDIQLEEVTFDGLPLPQVLQFLSKESRKRDPDKKGINFLINPNVLPVASAPVVDPTTGQVIPTPSPEPLDMNNVIVRFNLPLREVRLKDVLDAVVKVADRPVEYSVEEYGVVFSARPESHAGGAPVSPQSAGAGSLQVRTFRVDTNTFLAGLERAFGISLGGGSSVDSYDIEKIRVKLAQAERDMKRIARNVETGLVPTDDLEKAKLTRDLLALDLKQAESGRGRPDTNQGTGPAREVQDALRRLLVQLGINMEAPGKSIFYNELTGILMVRATFDDLNVVQAAIETLGGSGVEPGASVGSRRGGRAQNGATPYNEEMMRRYGLLP